MLYNFETFNWDTREEPINFPYEIRKKFFTLSIKRRNGFIKWLGKISKKYSGGINWWLKIPASRDPFISNLYKNLLIIEILKKKNIKKKIKILTISSKSLFLIIKKNKIFDLDKLKLKETKNEYFPLIKYLIFSLIIFFSVRLFSSKKDISIENNVTLIDTFFDYRFNNDDLVYPGLQNNLKKRKNKPYFVPNFFPSKNIINVIRNIIVFSKKNYIFKENYVNLINYINCAIQTLNKKKLKDSSVLFCNCNVSQIIDEELCSNKHFYSEFLSRLNLYFIKKLKDKNIKVAKTINRFENQPMDKAWNYGFRSNYPKAEVLGYQGYFYYPHMPHQSPTYYEEKAKVVPKKIIVTGKAFKKPRIEFSSKTKVVIGPSLGKGNFLKEIKKKYQYKFVLALCGIKVIDEKLLQWSFSAVRRNKNFKLIVKPHPILSIEKMIEKNSNIFKNQIVVSNESVNKLLEKTEIIISSGPTSIILESLVYGCKLLYPVLDPNDALIPKKIPISKKYLKFIYSADELFQQMLMLNKKKFLKKSNTLKNQLFTKTSNKNIQIFF